VSGFCLAFIMYRLSVLKDTPAVCGVVGEQHVSGWLNISFLELFHVVYDCCCWRSLNQIGESSPQACRYNLWVRPLQLVECFSHKLVLANGESICVHWPLLCPQLRGLHIANGPSLSEPQPTLSLRLHEGPGPLWAEAL
jgi:hypothetical protein